MIMSRFFVVLLFSVMQLALVSCAQTEENPECGTLLPPEGETQIDLILEYPYAEKIYDSSGIDMGDPESRRQFGSGWSFVEGKNKKHVWSVGLSSIIRFINLKDCDKTLTFKCMPYIYNNMPTQHIKVFLNDRLVGETDLIKGRKSYSFDFHASILKKGENILKFQYAYATIPVVVHPEQDDRRNLAVSFVSIEIRPISKDLLSIERSPGGCEIIRQPTDTILDYFVELPQNAVLMTAISESAETRGLSYEIHVKEDAMPEQVVFARKVKTSSRLLDRVQFWKKQIKWVDTEVPLTSYGKKIVRLRFKVSNSSPNNGHGDGYWLAPRIVIDDTGQPEAGEEVSDDSAIMAEATEEEREQDSPPSIFIYVIDALRADHLGCYGYHRDTSPNIDRFSEDSVLFERFITENSWTRPSVASLMTGLPQKLHGIQGHEDALDNSIIFISQILKKHSYATAFVSTNSNISETYGFNRGFDFFRVGGFKKLPTSSQKVTEAAFGWLEENKGERVFLYLHTTDPHAPYNPEEEFRIFKTVIENSGDMPTTSPESQVAGPDNSTTEIDLDNLKDLYDGEILQNDYAFGRFIDALKQWDMYDNSIIILTADHGEEFFEHEGFSHGISVYRESIHIPFIVKLPEQQFKGSTIGALGQIIDVSPTLLDLADIHVPYKMSGSSLKPVILGQRAKNRTFSSEVNSEGFDFRVSALYWKKWKLNIPYGPMNHIRVKDRGPLELFDIENDWEETENLYKEYPVLAGYLRQALKKNETALNKKAAQFGKPIKISTNELPEDIRNGLKALGYLK